MPLTNGYRGSPSGSPKKSLLVSGGCISIKSKIVQQVFRRCDGTPVLLLNFDRASPYFSSIRYDYSSSNDIGTGFDMLDSMTLHQACEYILNSAYDAGYPHTEAVQVVKYLQLIERINLELGLDLRSIREVNAHFYRTEEVQKALAKCHLDSDPRALTTLLRSIKGLLVIDNLLSETDFLLGSDRAQAFSLEGLSSTGCAFIDLTPAHTSHTEKQRQKSILYAAEGYTKPFTLLVNAGRIKLDDDIESFLNTMLHKGNQVVLLTDDIFAQSSEHETIRKSFDINLLGKHTGQSAESMSKAFHEIEKNRIQRTRTIDHRIFSSRFIDQLFNTNYTESETTITERKQIIETSQIASLSPSEAITVDNTGSSISYFSFIRL